MTAPEEIEKEAIKLPESERLKLANRLIESVEEIWSEINSQNWEQEMQTRISEVRSGAVKTIPGSAVFASLGKIAPGDES